MKFRQPGQSARPSPWLLILLAFLLLFALQRGLIHQLEHQHFRQGEISLANLPFGHGSHPMPGAIDHHCGTCLQITDLDQVLPGSVPALDTAAHTNPLVPARRLPTPLTTGNRPRNRSPPLA
jgi:hypothetical protein